jgi:hypothetical protein
VRPLASGQKATLDAANTMKMAERKHSNQDSDTESLSERKVSNPYHPGNVVFYSYDVLFEAAISKILEQARNDELVGERGIIHKNMPN